MCSACGRRTPTPFSRRATSTAGATIHRWKSSRAGGVWTASLPEARFGEGGKYKFLIERSGVRRYKADPYAFCSETGDKTASVYCALDGYEWRDGAYMESRSRNRAEDDAMPPLPVNIYEVHLGSWRRRPDGSLFSPTGSWRDELSALCRRDGVYARGADAGGRAPL